MDKREIKRLITGFLVLATVTGSLTLVFSNFFGQSAAREAQQNAASSSASAAVNGTDIPKIGDKALSEAVPTDPFGLGTTPSDTGITYDAAQPFPTSSAVSGNLTDGLASSLAYNIVQANPGGPSATSGLTVSPSDLQSSLQNYLKSAALSPVLYPIDESRINVAKQYSSDDLTTYLAKVGNVMTETSGPNGLGALMQSATAGSANADALTASNFVFAKAEEDLYALSVPAPLLGLHKSLLEYAELNKQVSGVDYTNDPVKALVYAEQFPRLSAVQSQKVGTEVGRVQQNLPKWLSEADDHPTPERQVAILLHINQAHAGGLPVTDIWHTLTSIFNGSGIWAQYGLSFTEWLRHLATQILKDQIVHRLVQQTIQWAQSGFHGKPGFVTNWQSFLRDAANGAAGASISQITPRLCTSFRPFVVNFLTGGGGVQSGPYGRVNCTLDQVVNAVKGDFWDFQNGGWVRFGQVGLEHPQDTVWGAIALSVEQLEADKVSAQNESQQQAQTGNGFLPTKSCVNYDTVPINKSDLDKVKFQSNFIGVTRCYTTFVGPTEGTCSEINGILQCKAEMCDVRLCKPGGEQITTPGNAVAEQVSKAVGGDLDNIISSQDLTNLVSVMINSAINRLVQLGEKGLLGLFKGGDNPSQPGSGSGSGGTGGGTGTSTLVDDPKEVNAQRQRVLQFVAAYQERIDQASSTLAGWETLATNTTSSLASVATSCSNRSAEAQDRITTINGLGGHVASDRAMLTGLSSQLDQIIQEVNAATTILELSDATDKLDALNNDLGTLAQRITVRTGQTSQVQGDAQANLQNNACSTPLSPIDDQ